MRLFIAIEPPEEIKEYLSSIKLPDFKGTAVKPSNIHLTLKFLGEVDEDKKNEIKKRLNKIKLEPINCTTSNIGYFPSEDYIKVIWIGLEPKGKLTNLQQEIDNQLKDLFPKDKNFHPHLTLARVKFIEDKEKFKETIKTLKTEKHEFTITEFKLLKSTLTKEGPIYEEI